MNIMDILGKNLTNLRSEKMITQEQLADAIGVTRKAISSYENGSRQPSYDILFRFASYFHVSIDFLLGRQSDLIIDATGLDGREYTIVVELVEGMVEKNNKLKR